MSQAGLAQTGRSVEQDVVQGFIACFGRGDSNFKVILGLVLSGKLGEAAGSQTGIQRSIFSTWLT